MSRRFLALLFAVFIACRADAAQRALILSTGPEDGAAADVVDGVLSARGFTVDRAASLPGSLSGYCCIWDIRPFDPLSTTAMNAYVGFLNQGHGVAMFGENNSCCANRNLSIETWVNDHLFAGPVDVSTTFEWLGVTAHNAVGGHPVTAGVGLVSYDGFGNGAFQNLGIWARTLTFRDPPNLPSAAVWEEGRIPAAPAGRVVTTLDINWLLETYNLTDNIRYTENIADYLCPVTTASLTVDILDPTTFQRQCPDAITVFGEITGTDEDCAQPTAFSASTPSLVTEPSGPRDTRRNDGPPGWVSPSRPRERTFTPPLMAVQAPTVVSIDVSVNGGSFSPVSSTNPSLPAPAPVTFIAGPVPLILGANTITIRTRDDRGNEAFDSVNGSLIDTLPPVISPPSCANVVVDLGPGCQLSYSQFPSATDLCDPTVTITSVPPLPISFNGPGQVAISYTARDDTNNTATCSRLVTALDVSGPAMFCPTPVTRQCSGRVDLDPTDPEVAAWLASATATDNCTLNPVVQNNATLFPTTCIPGTATTVTFTSQDSSMNTASCTSTYTVVDTTPPDFITTPTPLTVECSVAGGAPTTDPLIQDWLNAVQADDLCSATTNVTNDAAGVIAVSCPSASTTVTFTATDECGNAATIAGEVNVTDSVSPTLSAPAPLSLECDSPGGVASSNPNIQAWVAMAVASDVCSAVTTVATLPGLLASSCSPSAVTTVPFTATDTCGNSTTQNSTVSVVDTTPPTLSVPSPLTLECDSPAGIPIQDPRVQAWLSQVSAADICGTVSLSNNTPLTLPASCGTTVTVAFIATDNCGLQTTGTSTLTIVDTTAPALTVPAPLTVECSSQGGSPRTDVAIQTWLQSAVATDLCGTASIATNAPALIPAVCTTGSTVITFTATDGCGNSSQQTSTITVLDTAPPAVSPPLPLVLECVGPTGVPSTDPAVSSWLALVSATDACHGTSVTHDAPPTLPFACGGQLTTVTFTATDDCGNPATATSTITVSDLSPPVLTLPAELVLECNAQGGVDGSDPRILAWLAAASATDVCAGTSGVTNNAPAFFPAACGGGGNTVVTFTAIDPCGNEVTGTAAVRVRDTTGPVLLTPSPLTLECNSASGILLTDPQVQAWLQTASAIDTCNTTNVVHDTPALLTSGCVPGTTTTVTFTASDDCGNTTVGSGVITVVDTTVPTATPPNDLDLECTSPSGVPRTDPTIQAWLGSVSAVDVCSNVTLTDDSPPAFPFACSAGATTAVSFTAVDSCNNTTVTSSSVTVFDRTPPTLVAPGPLLLECSDAGGVPITDPQVQTWLAAAIPSDLCSSVTVTNDAPIFLSAGCGPGAVTTVTFTAIDDCGLTTTTSSTITVRDTTPPALTVPPQLVLECNQHGGVAIDDPQVQAWLAAATATDVCGATSLINDAPHFLAAGCTPGATTTVTFVATDTCGNQTAIASTIVVADTTPPLVAALLRPVSPQPPVSPRSSATSCSPPSSRRFVVECGGDDVCDPNVQLSARLVVTTYTVPAPTQCLLIVDEVVVLCGEVVEIQLTAPACPAQSSTSARPAVSPGSDGVPVVSGVSVILEVTGTDSCGNAATATFDPAATPSPACADTPPQDVLEDGTCCPPIAPPADPPCSLPPCGRASRASRVARAGSSGLKAGVGTLGRSRRDLAVAPW